MPNSETAVTPTNVGPAADPALLATSGATVEANELGLNMAVQAMQKFGRELENLPAESCKIVEQVLSSISTANQRTAVSQKSSRSERRSEPKDAFVGIVNAVVDFSPAEVNTKSIIETFVLSSFILTAFSLSAIVGGYFLAPFLNLFVPPVGAALFSSIIAPLAVYYQLSKGYGPLDGFRLLILTAAAQGVLSGSALSHLTISSEPFVALSTIAASFAVAVTAQSSRSASLAITGASSILVHLALGILEGALSPVYLLLSTLYTLASLIPVQLSARDQKFANVNLYSAVLVGLTIASKCLVYGIIGSSAIVEKTIQQNAEAVSV